MRDKVTRQCQQTTTCEEKGEPKQIRTEVPLLTSLTPYLAVLGVVHGFLEARGRAPHSFYLPPPPPPPTSPFLISLMDSMYVKHRDYLLPTSDLSASSVHTLRRMQNCVTRLILKKCKTDHITPPFQFLHWLIFQRRIQMV